MHTSISTIAYEGSATSIGSTITESRGTGTINDKYSFPTLPYLEGFYLDSNGTGSRLDISTTSLVSYNITTSSTQSYNSNTRIYTYTWNVVFTSVTFADNLESVILAVKRPDGSDLKPDTKLVYTGSLTSYASNTTSYAMYSFVPRVHDMIYAVWRWSTTYPSTTTITSHSASIAVKKNNYPGWDSVRGNTSLNQYV